MRESTLFAFGIAFLLAASLIMTWTTTEVNTPLPPSSQTVTTQQLFGPQYAYGELAPTQHAETTENTPLIYLSVMYAIISGALISYARYGKEIREAASSP